MSKRSVVIIAAGLMILGIGVWLLVEHLSTASGWGGESLPKTSERRDSPIARSTQGIDRENVMPDKITSSQNLAQEVGGANSLELLDLKAKALQLVKEWEIKNATPITAGYETGKMAVMLVPPGDASLLDSIQSLFKGHTNVVSKLKELMESTEIETTKHKVLIYAANQEDASKDTISTFKINKYEDIFLDPVTGKLRISSDTFIAPSPGNTARYAHLFDVSGD